MTRPRTWLINNPATDQAVASLQQRAVALGLFAAVLDRGQQLRIGPTQPRQQTDVEGVGLVGSR